MSSQRAVSVCGTRLLFLAAALLTAFSWACGGSQKNMITPEEEDLRKREIQSLWAEIQSMEGGRWDDGGGDGDGDGDDDDAPADGADEAVPYTTTEAARPQTTTAGRAEREAAALSERMGREDMCHQQDLPRQPRCADVCQLADSICHNAGKICQLANELGGDAWADQRCSAAAAACARSDERCCGCE